MVSSWALLAVLAPVAGCADVWGFRELSEPPDAGVAPPADVSTADAADSLRDGAGMPEEVVEATDTARGDAMDARPTAGDADAAERGECGAPDPLANCGGCGNVCDTTTGMPSCNGVKCGYACRTGRSDCNASVPPDTDGCECATPACCGNTCQTKHATGITPMDAYYDCNAQGHSASQAQAACQAFVTMSDGGGACTDTSKCCDGVAGVTCVAGVPPLTRSFCGTAAGRCYCWSYQGNNSGTVQTGNPSSCGIVCPSSGDPAWN
ncbi:MAG TPA: hypothetical protein VKU41_06750 [Polyangiaceae bacterium]|nr:hypothetical protein [Polyangiaceae bacterium]